MKTINEKTANETKVFDLQPVNSRKSFYGKCKVIDNGKTAKLQSYNTIVAEYDHNTNKMTVNGWYSFTTATHINAFLDFYGFETCSKKELENYNK